MGLITNITFQKWWQSTPTWWQVTNNAAHVNTPVIPLAQCESAQPNSLIGSEVILVMFESSI